MRNEPNLGQSQIVLNHSKNNGLQRKNEIGHLVKTNPNKANFEEQAVLNGFFHFVIVHYKAITDVGNERTRDNKAELFISVNRIGIIFIYCKGYLGKDGVSCERFNKFHGTPAVAPAAVFSGDI